MVSVLLRRYQIISNTWLWLLSFLQTPEHRFDIICSCIMEEILILLHYAFERMLIYQYIGITKGFSGPGSVDGIATAYRLDGPGIESRWGEIFRTSPDRPWGPPSLLFNGYRVFPGGKVLPGRDADPSRPSTAEVKNRVELYLYSP